MGCSRTRRDLTERLDGALSARATAAFDRHVAVCVDCAGLHRNAVRVSALLRSLPSAKAPDRILERLRPEIARARAEAVARPAWTRRVPTLWPAEGIWPARGWPLGVTPLPLGIGAAAAAAAIFVLAKIGPDDPVRRGPPIHFVFRDASQSARAEDPFVQGLVEGFRPGRAAGDLGAEAGRS
jgi:anti-sigma factor RsiW